MDWLRARPAEIDDTTRCRLLEHAARTSAVANLSAPALVTLIWVVLAGSGEVDPPLVVWTTAVAVNFLVYGANLRRMLRALRAGAPPRRENALLATSLASTGTLWGSLAFVVPPVTDGSAAAVTVFGMSVVLMVGNLVFTSGSTGPFLAFHLTLAATSGTGMLVAGNWRLALLLAFTTVGGAALNRELHRTVVGAVTLARRNELLAAQLAEANAGLAEVASRDPLTGLANRDVFRGRIRDIMTDRRPDGPLPAVVYFDIDHFKTVNDTYGHAVGDRLLLEVTDRLAQRVGPGELLTRIGGDEFVLLVDDGRDGRGLEAAGRVMDAFAAPFSLDDVTRRFTASVGVAVADLTCTHVELVARADTALYRAKALGRDRVQDWESMQSEAALHI
ncbi:diguanylate cyclase domain-containing protein [Spongisporangium articulatum]|uniref:Diguanylate cyclase domain-containing protein n=1 Tax=Spongisporangium articulatum TaxID=3362603 RepID=A0ABW8ARN3_9ACTN